MFILVLFPGFFTFANTKKCTDRGFEAARDCWPCRGPAKGL